MALAQAKYFPVLAGPLRMRAGLSRLGVDFGNGMADNRVFQRDGQSGAVLAAKARVLKAHPARYGWSEQASVRRLLGQVLPLIEARARDDTGTIEIAAGADARTRFDRFARQVAEDLVLLLRDEAGHERCVVAHVCAPSGWRPESIVGRSFDAIHQRVPEFDEVERRSGALVRAMFERGPYVRFVWTITPDTELDHHPDVYRPRWSNADRGYLRVERQVTVPFPQFAASLFSIRTYLYPFDTLSAEERSVLAVALRESSPAVLEYKGLQQHRERILNLLEGRS